MALPYNFDGRVIGLWGEARSGKDTVYQIIKELNPNVTHIGLADPIKKVAQMVYEFSDDQLWGHLKDDPDKRYPRGPCDSCGGAVACAELGCVDGALYLTPRYACQRLGEEWGRDCWDLTWISYAFRDVSEILRGRHPVPTTGSDAQKFVLVPTDKVIINNVRYINDVQSILDCGGLVFKIHREGAGLPGSAGDHATEQDFKAEVDVTAHIENNGTLAELKKAVIVALGRKQ